MGGIGAIGPAAVAFTFGVVLFAIVVAGVYAGVRRSRRHRKTGTLLILISVALPLSACCFGPNQMFRLSHGTYPLGGYPYDKVQAGMKAEEVIHALGEPHLVERRGEQMAKWLYWTDPWTMTYFWVEFAQDGRVVASGGD